MSGQLTLSVVIATAFRDAQLRNCLRSLAAQARRPNEIVIVDGAPAPGVEALVGELAPEIAIGTRYFRTSPPSAAVQRNVGADASAGQVILFLDDDAYPEPDCLDKMMRILEGDPGVGGVGVVISNQPCPPPSPRARRWFDFLAGEPRASYSGTVIGPAVNIGPEPTTDGRVVDVEWLNSGCTAYRREAFLAERFCPEFYGYSFMEDVDLSVRVARKWRLVVHTGAAMYHDTMPSRFKKPYARAKMSVANRYYVMTRSLGRRSAAMHARFLVFLAVSWGSSLVRSRGAREIASRFAELAGMAAGLLSVAASRLRPGRA